MVVKELKELRTPVLERFKALHIHFASARELLNEYLQVYLALCVHAGNPSELKNGGLLAAFPAVKKELLDELLAPIELLLNSESLTTPWTDVSTKTIGTTTPIDIL